MYMAYHPVEHIYWHAQSLPQDYDESGARMNVSFEDANLVSSLLSNGMHGPAIDIDHLSTLDDEHQFSVVVADPAGRINPYFIDWARRTLIESRFADSLVVNNHDGFSVVEVGLTARGVLIASRSYPRRHLYTEHMFGFVRYAAVLEALHAVGVVESGFYSAAVDRQSSFLRTPLNGKRPDVRFAGAIATIL